jgi:hypothetical protein
MKPTAPGILRSEVSFDCLRSCGSAADHRHARCAGRHDDNRRQLSSASAGAHPAIQVRGRLFRTMRKSAFALIAIRFGS